MQTYKSFSSLGMLTLLMIALYSTAAAVTINSATVSGSQLTIGGVGFTGALTVTLSGQKLVIVSNTSAQIVAAMNPVPAPGSYRLSVKVGRGSTTGYVTIPANPNIVAQLALTDQSGPITQTPLLTPSADGLYRVSGYLEAAQSAGAAQVYFYWTDDEGPEQSPSASFGGCPVPSYNGAYAAISCVFTVRVVAGKPISYAISGASESGMYNLFFTVDQLQ